MAVHLLLRNSSIFADPVDARRIYEPELGVKVQSKIEYVIYVLPLLLRRGLRERTAVWQSWFFCPARSATTLAWSRLCRVFCLIRKNPQGPSSWSSAVSTIEKPLPGTLSQSGWK